MARKPEPEKAANHERWLVSYADFITLLFAFFVVMFATSQADPEKAEKVQSSMRTAFASFGFFPMGSGTSPQILETGANAVGGPAIVVLPNVAPTPGPDGRGEGASVVDPLDPWAALPPEGVPPTPKPTPTPPPPAATPVPTPAPASGGPQPGGHSDQDDQLFQDLKNLLDEELRSGQVVLEKEKRGIVISLRDVGFFDSGKAELKPASLPVLAQLGGRLLKLAQQKDRRVTFRVEGHTDSELLSPANQERFGDNLGLSTARANAVIRNLRDRNRMPEKSLVASGYGSWRPIADNVTELGRARNRRVDIVILNDEYSDMEAPVGGL